MPVQNRDNGWRFLGRKHNSIDESTIGPAVQGKRVLITGAAGFIGSALARTLCQLSVEHLSLLDIAESGLHELALGLDREATVSHNLIVGDVCDAALLTEVFKRHCPQIILHAAAYKHVSLMEENSFAAAKTNVLGTRQIARAASTFGAVQMVLISTDKAVAPIGMMGATKRIAEFIILANRSSTQMNVVRLGNVLGSTGSVVPTLQRQIAQGGPITITDAACTRYFISIDEAIQRLLSALLLDCRSTIVVSDAAEVYRIVDLARFLVEDAGLSGREVNIRYTGLRPGEKLSERMTSDEETVAISSVHGLRRVVDSPQPSLQALTTAVAEIDVAVHQRDLRRLLRAISNVVPDYVPSRRVQEQVLDPTTVRTK